MYIVEVYQPLDSEVLKKTERVYGTGSNTRTRRLLPIWYKSFPWLHFCCSTLRVYCHQCKLASELNIRIQKADTAFSTEGFCNWKKATVRFKQHELSHAHQVAVEAHISRKRPINQQLVKQLNKTQQNRRYSLLKQLSALRYLLRQGLAIRNDHAGGSNLTVMLQMVLDEDQWVQDKRYQSPEIVNELIEIMGHSLLRSILANILSQQWFALLADETRDISNREQLVLCIRWVSESYEIHEDVVGLIQLENTTAETIHKALKSSMISLGFLLENCRGQGYDGASNFQGHISGVCKRLQDEYPAAIPVHCLAHCVNLCLQEVTRSVTCIKQGLNFAMDVIQLIKFPPKRQVLFENIKIQQDSQTSSIRSLCPTRWTVRTGAMQAIVVNYEVLRETMETSSHGTDDCSRRAGGLLAVMDRFSTYFGLKLSILIFSITEQLSVTLQGINTTVNDSYYAVEVCIKALERNRTDEYFQSFFEKVKSEAANKCDPPVLPRRRQIPKRIDDGASPHVFSNVEDLYRKEYFQAIDCVKGELERRFHQDNFLLVRNIETILINSANGKLCSFPETFKSTFGNDIDMQKLSLQIQLLPDAIKSNTTGIKEVTKVQTICDVLNEQPGVQKLLTEIHKLLKIYYTIPVTTASAERSFSALKCIKTYLRNSMTQQRLNHCMLLHVHVKQTDQLDLIDIAKEFVRRNERRRTLFGNF